MRDTHIPLSIARGRLRIFFAVCTLCTWFLFASTADVPAFLSFGIGGGNSIDETSRYPIKIELRGFLNTDPEPETLVLISLGVSTFRVVYRFDVRQARIVDYPRLPVSAILRRAGKYSVDFFVIGRRELLTKIGQSPPGTPLIVTGMFQQRRRKLQLLSIDIVDRLAVTSPVGIVESDVDAQD